MIDTVGRVSEILADRGLRLATAESCTGGMVAARFTDRPGASRFFEVGLVTYSDAAKRELLGVQQSTLDGHGAVSAPVVEEMLDGALGRGEAAVAITGIAGPGGGTHEKPVGTVWIGAAVQGSRAVRRFHFDGDRTRIREASANAAVDMLATLLEG